MELRTEDVCNFLSLTVIGMCVVMKVPQIWGAFSRGNTHGISLKSVLLEQSGYTLMMSYSFAMEYPVANYMETAFLLVQNFLMLALIIYTRDLLSPKVFIFFAVYLTVSSSIAYKLVPDFVLTIAISLCTPLGVSSKITQIYELYMKKEPGRLSVTTWCIAAYGCYVRVFTHLIQTGDGIIIFNFASSAILNSTIAAMIVYYHQQKKSKLY